MTVLILTVVLIAKADAEYCKAERKKAKADAGQSIAKALASLGERVAAGTLSQVQLEQVAPLIKSAASVEELENLVQQAERPVLSRS